MFSHTMPEFYFPFSYCLFYTTYSKYMISLRTISTLQYVVIYVFNIIGQVIYVLNIIDQVIFVGVDEFSMLVLAWFLFIHFILFEKPLKSSIADLHIYFMNDKMKWKILGVPEEWMLKYLLPWFSVFNTSIKIGNK